MKILGIFAHPDDETFSAGGTFALMKKNGHDCLVVSITMDTSREEEFQQACSILGINGKSLKYSRIHEHHRIPIINALITVILEFRPNIVITHQKLDYHHEHRLTREYALEAIEWASHTTQYNNAHQVDQVYEAETVVLLPAPDTYIDISNVIQIKEQAIKTYTSQQQKGGENFYLEFQRTRTRLRGLLSKVDYAEAFNLVKIQKISPFKPTKAKNTFPFEQY